MTPLNYLFFMKSIGLLAFTGFMATLNHELVGYKVFLKGQDEYNSNRKGESNSR